MTREADSGNTSNAPSLNMMTTWKVIRPHGVHWIKVFCDLNKIYPYTYPDLDMKAIHRCWKDQFYIFYQDSTRRYMSIEKKEFWGK